MLDKKQNSNNLFIWIQNGSQAKETTFNINITFGLGTANC